MAVAASLGLSEVARAKHFLILARIFGSSSELLKGGLSSGGGEGMSAAIGHHCERLAGEQAGAWPWSFAAPAVAIEPRICAV